MGSLYLPKSYQIDKKEQAAKLLRLDRIKAEVEHSHTLLRESQYARFEECERTILTMGQEIATKDKALDDQAAEIQRLSSIVFLLQGQKQEILERTKGALDCMKTEMTARLRERDDHILLLLERLHHAENDARKERLEKIMSQKEAYEHEKAKQNLDSELRVVSALAEARRREALAGTHRALEEEGVKQEERRSKFDEDFRNLEVFVSSAVAMATPSMPYNQPRKYNKKISTDPSPLSSSSSHGTSPTASLSLMPLAVGTSPQSSSHISASHHPPPPSSSSPPRPPSSVPVPTVLPGPCSSDAVAASSRRDHSAAAVPPLSSFDSSTLESAYASTPYRYMPPQNVRSPPMTVLTPVRPANQPSLFANGHPSTVPTLKVNFLKTPMR